MPVSFKHLAMLLLAAVTAFALDRIGGLRWVENGFTAARMAAAPKTATGEIVFVAIDARSIREIGTWPWPRQIHAQLIERLVADDASEIFLDVDLSTPSNSESDRQLAEVLSRAGGKVTLPVFSQTSRAGSAQAVTTETMPLQMFLDRAWLASVNVSTGPNGRLWRYPWGQTIDGVAVASAAAVMSGVFGPMDADFAVDFAIAPSTVPTYSAVDVIRGRLDPAAFENRSVVIGAEAAELGDRVAVPVHRIVTGPMLHILAAETLRQDVALIPAAKLPLFAGVAALALGLAMSPLGSHPFILTGVFGAISLLIEAAAFALQVKTSIVLPTPLLHATLFAIGAAVAARELDKRRWSLHGSMIETRNSQNVLRQVVMDSSDAIVVVEEAGGIVEMSARVREVFDSPLVDAPTRVEHLLPTQISAMAHKAMAALRAGKPDARIAKRLDVFQNGRRLVLDCAITPSWLQRVGSGRFGAPPSIIACITVQDVTLTHQQQSRLDYLARFDVLTGALNRPEFSARLSEALQTGDHAVFALNLHRFKTVNTTLGRSVGDGVLRVFLERLEECDPRLLKAGRLGGDVFAVACPGHDTKTVNAVTDALLATAAEPFVVDGATVNVGMRVGISLAALGGDAATSIGQAELALDGAREIAGQGALRYEDETSGRQERARQIERALWSAVENDELYLAYQPQVEIDSSRLVGVEALIRWRHPSMGEISPRDFIPVAESSGFIEELGQWVLHRACQEAARWPTDVPIAVNVSPLQFQRGDVVVDVRRALAASNLSPARLYLEITESLFLRRSESLMATLFELRGMGVRLALDDFGAGFSSLGYLADLPVDKLKLDRLFTTGLEQAEAGSAIIASLVTMCEKLGFELLCEGVETPAQSGRLRALGCRQAQGYLFGRPQSAASLAALLRSPSADKLVA